MEICLILACVICYVERRGECGLGSRAEGVGDTGLLVEVAAPNSNSNWQA